MHLFICIITSNLNRTHDLIPDSMMKHVSNVYQCLFSFHSFFRALLLLLLSN
jgi:hypothetical protein